MVGGLVIRPESHLDSAGDTVARCSRCWYGYMLQGARHADLLAMKLNRPHVARERRIGAVRAWRRRGVRVTPALAVRGRHGARGGGDGSQQVATLAGGARR